MTKFETLGLSAPILRALQANRYHAATPIQEQAIPQVVEGRDLVGCAQTGTGKTAAFAVPVLEQLLTDRRPKAERRGKRRSNSPRVRALILAPTRELAVQIGESFARYGQFTHLRQTVIYGGVRQEPQVNALRSGVDIVVATPGRLLDLIGQGYIRLDAVEILILDEADRMLDMGFIHDLRKIVAHVPKDRQTLMFSATMPDTIQQLAATLLRKPVRVHVAPSATTPDKVEQSVYFVEPGQKPKLLSRFLRRTTRQRVLVFTRTKRGADRVARSLRTAGVRAIAIHGEKSQGARRSAIRDFNSPEPPVLVATDIAARGLDISGISHVVNYDLPECPETYVHRIGRTARAGAEGCAISFCGGHERPWLKRIERLIGRSVTVNETPRGTSTNVSPPTEPTAGVESAKDSSRPADKTFSTVNKRSKRRKGKHPSAGRSKSSKRTFARVS